MDERLTADWQRLCDRWKAKGYGSLSESEKVWLNVRALIDSVENGGLISYFYNSGADTYSDCLSALNRLEAPEIVERVERLGELFGDSVPGTLEQRNEIIDAWPEDGPQDDLVQETDDVLMPLMERLDQRLDAYLVKEGFGR